MALYGNLRDYKFGDAASDIRGTEIFGANNEKLGAIDDVIFDSNSGEMKYVVVNTGGWLKANRFIVPARQIREDEARNDRYFVSLNQEQIERFPEYEETMLEDEKDFGDYEKRYEDSWTDGPVLHQEGSTRILTPEASEMPAAGSGTAHFPESGRSVRTIAEDLPRFGATSDSNSSTGRGLIDDRPLEPVAGAAGDKPRIGAEVDSEGIDGSRDETSGVVASGDQCATDLRRRWDDFQERLRTEREQIINRPRKDRAA